MMTRLAAIVALATALLAVPAGAQDDAGDALEPSSAETSILGVVAANGGTFGDGRLTLTGVEPEAVWFTDRPARSSGVYGIKRVLRVFFDGQTPPNAALTFRDAGKDDDVTVVELSEPEYDRGAKRLTFDASVLDDPATTLDAASALRGFAERHDSKVPKSFDAVDVFIDAAPTPDVQCPVAFPHWTFGSPPPREALVSGGLDCVQAEFLTANTTVAPDATCKAPNGWTCALTAPTSSPGKILIYGTSEPADYIAANIS